VKMLDGYGVFLPESKRSFPSPWVSFCKLFGLSRLFPQSRRFSRYSLPYLSADRQHKVEVLSGAFMLLRHEALDKIGLLDEAFFMYGEDIDLSYRMITGGYKNYYIPERILHYKGESTKQNDMKYIKAFYGSMLIFFKKHYPHSGWLMTFFIRIAVLLSATAGSFFRFLRGGGKGRGRSKHLRLLVLCREEHFKMIEAACLQKMPELEFVNLWDLDEERVMDAICRRNQMKSFSDIAFYYPDVRFDQMLLLMDAMPNKKTNYHLYTQINERLVSPDK
ncbi:MAG: glycosyltransferase, partial [Tannerellaceae bacterium]